MHTALLMSVVEPGTEEKKIERMIYGIGNIQLLYCTNSKTSYRQTRKTKDHLITRHYIEQNERVEKSLICRSLISVAY